VSPGFVFTRQRFIHTIRVNQVRETMVAQKNAALPDGLKIAGYCIVKTIACGGFSIVYLAQDSTGNAVAIKEYLPSELALRHSGAVVPVITAANRALFRIGLRYFFDEARALALIKHPNVVRARDFFCANHTAYMVMAYERGRSLQQHIALKHASGAKLAEPFIVRTFVGVINGLRAVHANRLLHLDLKPANILLRPNGQPVLLDIGGTRPGAAVAVTSQHRHESTHWPTLVSTHVPVFTPAFAPPELHSGRAPLGPWSDAYGIGAALYACMVGQPPQPADQRAIFDVSSDRLAALAGIYSAPLCDVVRWCLMLDALARPQSLLELQLRLHRLSPLQPQPRLDIGA
jgi:serine/threonine protein kinase